MTGKSAHPMDMYVLPITISGPVQGVVPDFQTFNLFTKSVLRRNLKSHLHTVARDPLFMYLLYAASAYYVVCTNI